MPGANVDADNRTGETASQPPKKDILPAISSTANQGKIQIANNKNKCSNLCKRKPNK